MRDDGATTMPPRSAPSRPPPWEALSLVANFLDAASLAAASCVSTSWHAAFSGDHLWARLCRCHYPSAIGLLPLYNNVNAGDRCSSPHRRLFALFHAAASRGRSLPAPRLALDDVTFAIDLFAAGGKNTLSFAVAASDAGVKKAPGGVFQFAVDVSDRNAVAGPGKHWSVRWTAVRTGHGVAPAAAIVMMDAKVPASRAGALSCGVRGEAWATVALPAPGCGGGKLEAEVVVEVSGEDRLVEKVRIGVLLDCRYVSVDAGLRYLQHFLL
ncbi:probable F-box protein At5g04010 [Triticum dicoccoides]|uniref:probable F-box protein At5g04010 n=1 Tax=Triticum dicoccoides TaxID=85692 RepID=UPI0008436D4E|nr:probable F-box protein At5g04010 [Triticum dicoccoides]XP_044337326.1 probable F-box protein At5g04010 [Triticum aestivum]